MDEEICISEVTFVAGCWKESVKGQGAGSGRWRVWYLFEIRGSRGGLLDEMTSAMTGRPVEAPEHL